MRVGPPVSGPTSAGAASGGAPAPGVAPEASAIDRATLLAYRETDYRVHDDPPFTMRVDAPCPALGAAHERAAVRSSAFVTACNPLGRLLDAAANAALHEGLGRDLDARGLARVEGLGLHRSSGWPGEPSYLVLGLESGPARSLGAALRQNALLVAGPDAVPRLVLLR